MAWFLSPKSPNPQNCLGALSCQAIALAKQSKAKQSEAKQSKAKQSNSKQLKAAHGRENNITYLRY
jgi:hypothetical protein